MLDTPPYFASQKEFVQWMLDREDHIFPLHQIEVTKSGARKCACGKKDCDTIGKHPFGRAVGKHPKPYSWKAKQNPKRNLAMSLPVNHVLYRGFGMFLGASGACALDVDPKNGADDFSAILERNGFAEKWPEATGDEEQDLQALYSFAARLGKFLGARMVIHSGSGDPWSIHVKWDAPKTWSQDKGCGKTRYWLTGKKSLEWLSGVRYIVLPFSPHKSGKQYRLLYLNTDPGNAGQLTPTPFLLDLLQEQIDADFAKDERKSIQEEDFAKNFVDGVDDYERGEHEGDEDDVDDTEDGDDAPRRPRRPNYRFHANDSDHDKLIRRATAYIRTLPPAVSGQGGSKATSRAASKLVIGFGLSPAEALPILEIFNQTCRPPWSPAELYRKLEWANEQPGPRGTILAQDAERERERERKREQERKKYGPGENSLDRFRSHKRAAKAARLAADAIAEYAGFSPEPAPTLTPLMQVLSTIDVSDLAGPRDPDLGDVKMLRAYDPPPLTEEQEQEQRIYALPCNSRCGYVKGLYRTDGEARSMFVKTRCGCWRGCQRCRAKNQKIWTDHTVSIFLPLPSIYLWNGPIEQSAAIRARIKRIRGHYRQVAQPSDTCTIYSDAAFADSRELTGKQAAEHVKRAIQNIPIDQGRPVSGSHAWGLPRKPDKGWTALPDRIGNDFSKLVEFCGKCNLNGKHLDVKSFTASRGYMLKIGKTALENLIDWFALETVPPNGDLSKGPPGFKFHGKYYGGRNGPKDGEPDPADDKYTGPGATVGGAKQSHTPGAPNFTFRIRLDGENDQDSKEKMGAGEFVGSTADNGGEISDW